MSVLVLITGTGRSGTSTMSGTFHHLGLHVPGPYLGANDSNPKGFFESKWAVSFHKQITDAAGIHDFDGRPSAFDRAQAAITPELRAQLVAFLTEQARESDQVVVKDPRSVWGQSLWREAAAEAGLDIAYVSMLRHPAEVLGSRATHYAKGGDAEQRRRYEIFNLARWINNSVISERETRGQRRAFVRYNDLLTDWRPVLVGLGEQFGLTYDVDLAPGTPTPVDEFIDPDLRRQRVTWEELELPVELQDVAQQAYDALDLLADARGEDAHASLELDIQGARYRRIFDEASAISHDAMEEAKATARRAGAKAAREKQTERQTQAARAAAASVEARPVSEVGARDLLRVAGRRLVSRIRPTR